MGSSARPGVPSVHRPRRAGSRSPGPIIGVVVSLAGLVLAGTPIVAAPTSHLATFSAPYGGGFGFTYLAAWSGCTHATTLVNASANRSTGWGHAADGVSANHSTCPYPGVRDIVAETDWMFNSTNFTGTGSHSAVANWSLRWSVALGVNASPTGRCATCHAEAFYRIGVWVAILDVTSGVVSCYTLPCVSYGWSHGHLVRLLGSTAYTASLRFSPQVRSGAFYLAATDTYQLVAGVTLQVGASSNANHQVAWATVSLRGGVGHVHLLQMYVL